jgi:hypothetical protein
LLHLQKSYICRIVSDCNKPYDYYRCPAVKPRITFWSLGREIFNKESKNEIAKKGGERVYAD